MKMSKQKQKWKNTSKANINWREWLSQPQTLFSVTFSIALGPAPITLKTF
jgi:hypothetical protein